MQFIDKIFKLHNLLKLRRTPISGPEIDAALRCGKATRQRVIADLRDRLGAPLVCARGRGYYYDRDDPRGVFELPGLWLSAQELQALIACQHVLVNLAPGLLANEIGQLRDHLEQLLGRTQGVKLPQLARIRILSQAYRQRNDPLFLLIATALFNERQLQIEYQARGSGGYCGARVVSPQNLVLYKDNWYLDAYCHYRDQLRTFALDCIGRAETLDAPSRLIDSRQLHQHFGNSYGIFAGPAEHVAVLQFSAQAARWVADEHWHSQQQSRRLPDGGYQLTIPFNRHEELLMDILKYGAEVEVIEPLFLRDLVKRTAERMLTTYATQNPS